MPYFGQLPSWGHMLQKVGVPVESIGKLHYRSQDDDDGFDQKHIPMMVYKGVGMVWGSIRREHERKTRDNRMLGEYMRYLFISFANLKHDGRTIELVKIMKSISPFIGVTKTKPMFKVNSEVAEIIEISFLDLLDDNNVGTIQITNSYMKETLVPSFNINGSVIWGATAMILSEIKEVLKKTQL